jgi:hypothetical protein
MKKLLFVAFALIAAMVVIGVTVAMTRTGEIEPEVTDEEAPTE